jgi:hypothetical protein
MHVGGDFYFEKNMSSMGAAGKTSSRLGYISIHHSPIPLSLRLLLKMENKVREEGPRNFSSITVERRVERGITERQSFPISRQTRR